MQKHGDFVNKKPVNEYFGNDKGQQHMLSTYLCNLRRIWQLGNVNNVVCVVLYRHHMVAVVRPVNQIYSPSYCHHLHLPNLHTVNKNLRTTK
jgi:hypothetical protein